MCFTFKKNNKQTKMCFTFKKNNKQTKKSVNCCLQDDASAGIQSLQTSIKVSLPKPIERTIVKAFAMELC